MLTKQDQYEDELQYAVSYRQEHRVERDNVPLPGRFETTSSARLARESRFRRGNRSTQRGFQYRGSSTPHF